MKDRSNKEVLSNGKILSKLKENLSVLFVVLAYLALLVFKPQMAVDSVISSGYYIKEMLMIMPVVFVLTALLDLWIPKEKIEKSLGDESKAKGVLLSFVLGSVSAGPIYAAFPFCIMLLKKGASIKNIIIILSSWAVIKVPMLAMEAKFLGPKFMVIRYLLTVAAIIVFSTMASKIVKRKDIPAKDASPKSGLHLNADACMGCSMCAKNHPALFYMKNKKAYVNKDINNLPFGINDPPLDILESAINSCPVKAIEYIPME